MSNLIKPVQSRHGRGWSVVRREDGQRWGVKGKVYVKTQSGYFTHPVMRAGWPTPTLTVEYNALSTLSRLGIHVPEIVDYRVEDTVIELTIREVADAEPLDEFLQGTADVERKDQAVRNLAQQIRNLHTAGWVHGALGNCHILIQKQDLNVVLIDFEKARWNPLRRYSDLERFWRRTACLNEEQSRLFQAVYTGRGSTGTS
jgi:tRNA A-37 threonylcarbamoyl transferase component Bud32